MCVLYTLYITLHHYTSLYITVHCIHLYPSVSIVIDKTNASPGLPWVFEHNGLNVSKWSSDSSLSFAWLDLIETLLSFVVLLLVPPGRHVAQASTIYRSDHGKLPPAFRLTFCFDTCYPSCFQLHAANGPKPKDSSPRGTPNKTRVTRLRRQPVLYRNQTACGPNESPKNGRWIMLDPIFDFSKWSPRSKAFLSFQLHVVHLGSNTILTSHLAHGSWYAMTQNGNENWAVIDMNLGAAISSNSQSFYVSWP